MSWQVWLYQKRVDYPTLIFLNQNIPCLSHPFMEIFLGSQSFLFSILSSFIKNLLINKIAEGRGTLLASLISHWMLTGYWVMNRSKRKRLWLTTSKRNTHRFFKRWQFGPKLWWIFLIRWWMDGQNLPRQSLFWTIMVSNMWFLKFIYCGVGEVGGLFNPQISVTFGI